MSLENVGDVAARATDTQHVRYRLRWIPERSCAPASRVEIRAAPKKAFHQWTVAEVDMERARIEYCWKRNPTVGEMFGNRRQGILRVSLPYGARKGEPLDITLLLVPPYFAGCDLTLNLFTLPPVPEGGEDEVPEGEAEPGSTCTLPVSAGPVYRLGVYAHPVADLEGTVRLALQPEDRFGNAAAFASDVKTEIAWQGQTRTEFVKSGTILNLPAPTGTNDRAEVRLPVDALGQEEDVSNASAALGVCTLLSNPVMADAKAFADGADLRPAFGELHWHTDYSVDGQTPFDVAVRRGRDEMNLDFVAPGDHNTAGELWQETVRVLDEFEDPGRFATIYGWENSSGQGHENYYFLEPDHPAVCHGPAGLTWNCGPRAAAAILEEQTGVLAIPHHTNAVAKARRPSDDTPFWYSFPWDRPTPAHRLAEIMQNRGNQERDGAGDRWRCYYQCNGGSIQDGLELGYRIGFTGGTDNHCGNPGRVATMDICPVGTASVGQILTGVWTESVERKSVFSALWERRTWAVWNTRAIVWFSVNDAPLGTEIEVEKGSALTARIRIAAEAPLQLLELVSEREVVWSSSATESEVDLAVELPPVEDSTHVYLRGLVRNREEGILYASPVFIDVKE